MAMLAVKEGDLDRADALVSDLRHQRQMRHIEFSVICLTSIQVFIARRDFRAARSWLDVWKRFQPEHPKIAEAERLVNMKAMHAR